jgi:hypothetical protein
MHRNYFLKQILFLFLLITPIAIFGQTSSYSPFYKSYVWENTPISFNTDSLLEPAVILKDFLMVEFAFEDNDLWLFETTHKIVAVKNEEGVQAFNTLQISLRTNEELKDLRIRSFSPQNEVFELDTNKVRGVTSGNVNSFSQGGIIKKYAIGGVSKGSIVEYFYTIKKKPVFFSSEFLQTQLPTFNVHFELRSPAHLLFQVKTYNNLPDTALTINENYLAVKVQKSYLPAIRNEKYANFLNHLARVEYSLVKNLTQPSRKILTWDLAAKDFYSYYVIQDKKIEKTYKAELKKLKIDNLSSEAKILAIENYIKQNIFYQQGNAPEFSDPIALLKNKYANAEGIMRAFCLFFKLAQIDFQLVYTTKRYYKYFDPEFNGWNFLDNALLFLPQVNQFIEPTENFLRLGPPSMEYINNSGLFISEVNLGGIKNPLGKIKKIDSPQYSSTYNNITARVFWNTDLSAPNLEYQLSSGGYYARAFREGYFSTPDDKKNEFARLIMKNYFEDFEIKNIETQNLDFETPDFVRPIIFKARGTVAQLVEQAGNNYLLKIGLLLGEQVQMYNESERKLPIELEYPHILLRKISVKIPKGYKLENLETINIQHFALENGDTTMKFFSQYSLEGEELLIFVEEYYKKITYPVEQYTAFQKVINAAADFNKVALVLKKEN